MKREDIVVAGSRALAEGGFSAVDLAAIAETVGLKPTSIRYYFKNREDLAEAVYIRRIEELERSFVIAQTEDTVFDAVHRLLRIELSRLLEYAEGRGMRPVQLGEIRSLQTERRRKIARHFFKLVERAKGLLAAHGVSGADSSNATSAYLLLENVFWLPAWINQYRTWEYDHVARHLARLICDGPFPKGNMPNYSVMDEDGPDDSSGQVDRNAFLRAATRLICDRGYRGTSIDLIAAELGVTKGSFYHHNQMKISLVEECFAESYARIGNFQRRSRELSQDAATRIASVQASIVRLQFEQMAPIIRASALPTLPSKLRAAVIDDAKPIIRWLAGELARADMQMRGTAGMDPYIGAQYLSIGANAAYDIARFAPKDGPAPDQTHYVRLLLSGITCRVWA